MKFLWWLKYAAVQGKERNRRDQSPGRELGVAMGLEARRYWSFASDRTISN